MGWSAILDIFNKLLSSRKEAQADELNRLNTEFQKALRNGKTHLASQIHKRMKKLREKIKYDNQK